MMLSVSLHEPFVCTPGLTPYERTPWAGQELAFIKGQRAGESWEFSSQTSFSTTISGLTLSDLEKKAATLLYGKELAPYPLIIKFIDAGAPLSIQVHPKEARGAALPKTECWQIVKAAPGAHIFLGLKIEVRKEQFLLQMRQKKDLSVLLNKIEVKDGDAFFIPSGTLHALGAGLLVYEVQERSETTFRAYDWNRRVEGQERPLHYDEVEWATTWEPCDVTALYRKEKIECPFFLTERKKLSSDPTHATSGRVYTAWKNPVTFYWNGGSLIAHPGTTVFIPACCDAVYIAGHEAECLITCHR